jgi:hypothetical protein
MVAGVAGAVKHDSLDLRSSIDIRAQNKEVKLVLRNGYSVLYESCDLYCPGIARGMLMGFRWRFKQSPLGFSLRFTCPASTNRRMPPKVFHVKHPS